MIYKSNDIAVEVKLACHKMTLCTMTRNTPVITKMKKNMANLRKTCFPNLIQYFCIYFYMFSTLMLLEDEIESANLNFLLEYYVPD